MAFLLSQSQRKRLEPQSPLFRLPKELRDTIYDMLLPYATLDQYYRLEWHQGETAIMYVCRKVHGEASGRLYRCFDIFYFGEDDCEDCLNVVPDSSNIPELEEDFSTLSSSLESFSILEEVEVEDYVMVDRRSCLCSMW